MDNLSTFSESIEICSLSFTSELLSWITEDWLVDDSFCELTSLSVGKWEICTCGFANLFWRFNKTASLYGGLMGPWVGGRYV